MSEAYSALLQRVRDIGKLQAIEFLLDWDQQTYMPSAGVEGRAELLAIIAALKHERKSDARVGELLGELAGESDPVRATNIRETRRLYNRAVKVPTELVEEIARTASRAHEIWAQARADNDFAAFAPMLAKMIDLKRREADCLGYRGEPYDALLDEFEPGATTGEIAAMFTSLRERLAPLVRAIAGATRKPDGSILKRRFPRQAQEQMARRFAEAMGFDFAAGRLDVSVHPFCTSMSSRDVRITTRYDESFLPPAVFGVMHEVGHGLYEQGLDAEQVFTPMGSAVSLGVHESQSRLWENFVGRSHAFWEHHYASARQLFPEALADIELDAFYGAINSVTPSLIRVEADEVTYNLHIIVRFEIERDLINRRLEAADVPAAWNQRMTDLVGITPANDAQGCLQDIHWSMGAFGYFPTYTLGNLYAAQFFAAAREALGDLDAALRAGELEPLREWLRANIHRHGMRYRARELCEHVTGSPLSIDPFMNYVNAKFRPIYGLA